MILKRLLVTTSVSTLITAGSLVFLVGSSLAQTNQSSISTSDSQFLKDVAQDGMTEVQLGQLALQRSGSQQVKDFARRMIRDHTQANNQLSQLAAQKGVTLPKGIGVEHRALTAILSRLSGSNFDRVYMNYMVEDHTQDVQFNFPLEANAGQDADVKAFAAQLLPTLQDHLQMARSIQTAQINSNSGYSQSNNNDYNSSYSQSSNGNYSSQSEQGSGQGVRALW